MGFYTVAIVLGVGIDLAILYVVRVVRQRRAGIADPVLGHAVRMEGHGSAEGGFGWAVCDGYVIGFSIVTDTSLLDFLKAIYNLETQKFFYLSYSNHDFKTSHGVGAYFIRIKDDPNAVGA